MDNASVLDPVCEKMLASWNSKLDFAGRGMRYHFCSPECRSRFDADPDRFLGADTGLSVSRRRGSLALPVFGLGCGGGGAANIERELKRTQGILSSYVNPATETAYVDYNPDVVSLEGIVDVIEDCGYKSLHVVRGRVSANEDQAEGGGWLHRLSRACSSATWWFRLLP
jgi:YHS domain-containing protein/copper chaperone CopZ